MSSYIIYFIKYIDKFILDGKQYILKMKERNFFILKYLESCLLK